MTITESAARTRPGMDRSGSFVSPEHFDGIDEHIAGQEQEAGADDSRGGALRGFPPGLIAVATQAPQGGETTGHLDGGIEAKPDKGDAPGHESSDERHDALDRIPADREV